MSSTKYILAAALALFALPACNDGREAIRYPGSYNVGRAATADTLPEVPKAQAEESRSSGSSRSRGTRSLSPAR